MFPEQQFKQQDISKWVGLEAWKMLRDNMVAERPVMTGERQREEQERTMMKRIHEGTHG